MPMKRIVIALVLLAVGASTAPSWAQTLNAKRTAMGGVVMPSMGLGSPADNVAYRGVPKDPAASADLPLPIGLIPWIANPPVLDPDDPEFNVYKLANHLYNPPWNLQLVEPEPPSSDIVVELGRDHLAVELGEIANLFPDTESRFAGIAAAPGLGFGIRNLFVSASALVEYENTLSLNDALHGALARGQAFRTHTEYALFDNARGQVAASGQLGWAGALWSAGDPRSGGSTLYAGVRAKLLRGLAYGDAQNAVTFTTEDTLFGDAPIDLEYGGAFRSAGPANGGWGAGVDLGAVWMVNGFELGVALNDLGSQIAWRVEEGIGERDSVTGDFELHTMRRDVPFTSRIPKRATVNVGKRFGSVLVAADVTHSLRRTSGHLGMETWVGPMALRSGASLDANQRMQLSGGLGFRLGRLGLDLAIATHNRNISRERGLELGAGLSLYR